LLRLADPQPVSVGIVEPEFLVTVEREIEIRHLDALAAEHRMVGRPSRSRRCGSPP